MLWDIIDLKSFERGETKIPSFVTETTYFSFPAAMEIVRNMDSTEVQE